MFGNKRFEHKLSEHGGRGVAVAGLMVGVMAMLPAAASGASGSDLANPKLVVAQSVLQGVSCASLGTCSAVGDHAAGAGPELTLAQRWNGTSWAIQPTPSPAGAPDAYLYGVSCASASACTAVGHYSTSGVYETLAERWNGTGWQAQSTPNLGGAEVGYLSGVSCASDSACIAVGYYATVSGEFALAERWNGTSWELQSAPNPAGAIDSRLRGVSCTSASACTAVGFTENTAGAEVTFAERWNGSSWTIQTTPNPKASKGSVLTGVSCATVGACTAVGYYISNTAGLSALAERWNGSSWQVQSPPTPAGGEEGNLAGVSCASANACTAIGNYATGSEELALTERWNGVSWQLQNTPSPAGAKDAELNGVSCASASACTAVGDYYTSVTWKKLAERWNGTSWTI
jgi:hypothetical protein